MRIYRAISGKPVHRHVYGTGVESFQKGLSRDMKCKEELRNLSYQIHSTADLKTSQFRKLYALD